MSATLPVTILRGVQAILAIIVMGTAAAVASFFSGAAQGCDGFCDGFIIVVPAQIDFILFCAVWSILIVIVLALVSIWVASVSHPIVVTVLDGLTMIFWFAGAIALAVITGAATGPLPSSYRTLQACVAFSFFAWGAFLATFIIDLLAIIKGNTGRDKYANNQLPELQQTV